MENGEKVSLLSFLFQCSFFMLRRLSSVFPTFGLLRPATLIPLPVICILPLAAIPLLAYNPCASSM